MDAGLWPLVSSGLAVLLAGNIFFVKRLVDKLDKTCDIVQNLQTQVAVLYAQFNPANGQGRLGHQ